MTPDVVVDIGNSRMKWGRGVPIRMVSLSPDDQGEWENQLTNWAMSGRVHWAVASVHPVRVERFESWATARGDQVRIISHSDIRLPLDVDEPSKVGIDRLLNGIAARAAFSDEIFEKGTHIVVFGVGSAMTMDLLHEGVLFRGGAILPGPWMMARALHEFTAKLPQVDPQPTEPLDPVGRNTTQAMQSGIQLAILGAAASFLQGIRGHPAYPRPAVVVTGGGHDFLERLWNVAEIEAIVFNPELTLQGIRIAAEALP